MSTIAAAPTRPVSWVLAPACSATAVREPLVLTGKPWKSPAAMLAAPMPIISRLPSTSWPVRAANADAVEIVSVSETRAMPERAGDEQRRGRDADGRDGERREALRQRPDERHAVVAEVERRPTAAIASDDRDEDAGDRRQPGAAARGSAPG